MSVILTLEKLRQEDNCEFKVSLGYIVSSRRIQAPELRLNLRGGGEKWKEEEEERERRERGRRRGEEGRGREGKEEPYNGQFEFGKHFQIDQQHRGASLTCKPRPAASLVLCLNTQHGLKQSSCAAGLLFMPPKLAQPPALPMSGHDLKCCHVSILSLHLGYFCLQVYVKMYKMSFLHCYICLRNTKWGFYFYYLIQFVQWARVCAHMSMCVSTGQRTTWRNQICPSILWVPGQPPTVRLSGKRLYL